MTNDQAIVAMLAAGRLRVDTASGRVFAPLSNTPDKPIGAVTAKGYLRTCVNFQGRSWYLMVHRIVWISVHGPLESGFSIDHLDRRGKTDNRLVNLEAVPLHVNTRRAKDDGAYCGVGRKDGIRDNKGRFGKKAAGRLLDGRTWDEVPDAR